MIVKELAKVIEKITLHYSRRTFVVTSLILGIEIVVMRNILGHSELTTTQRYAKVVDDLREKEMDKWDKLVKEEASDAGHHDIVCPGCENTVLKIEKGIIALNKIPLVCPYCSTSFSHNLKEINPESGNIPV